MKARFVALVNVLFFVKHGQVWKDLNGWDAWAPLCWTTAARYVEARAVSHQRSPTAIDLIQAYGQVPFGGGIPSYLSPSNEVLELFVGVPDLPWNVEYMSAPVSPVIMGLYKIARGGFKFINGPGEVLIVTHWTSVPTEQVDDAATIMRRAALIKQYGAEEQVRMCILLRHSCHSAQVLTVSVAREQILIYAAWQTCQVRWDHDWPSWSHSSLDGTPEIFIQRVFKINSSTKSLVERLCDFKIYELSAVT